MPDYTHPWFVRLETRGPNDDAIRYTYEAVGVELTVTRSYGETLVGRALIPLPADADFKLTGRIKQETLELIAPTTEEANAVLARAHLQAQAVREAVELLDRGRWGAALDVLRRTL